MGEYRKEWEGMRNIRRDWDEREGREAGRSVSFQGRLLRADRICIVLDCIGRCSTTSLESTLTVCLPFSHTSGPEDTH